jgi:prolyl 4-hydroxylase
VGTPRDWQKGLSIIIKAAKEGNSRAMAQLAFLSFMVPEGKLKALGDELLKLAAEGLDIIAVYAYAKRTLNGTPTIWDQDKAKTMLALAAHAGRHPLAIQDPAIQGVQPPSQPPLPTGDLSGVDWAKLEEGLKTPPVPKSLETEAVSDNPIIVTFPGFMTGEETDYLIGMASRHLNPSQVVDPLTGKFIQDEYRTSSDMRFWPTLQDLAVYALLERIALATGEPITHQEMLGVLKYEPGQEYKPHGDYLTADFEGKNTEVERSGQRIKTFLTYLNEEFEGGETEFVNIDIKTRGKKGDGLMFVNVTKDMQPNTLTIHAGRPITKGIKWLSTMWIREKEYRSR